MPWWTKPRSPQEAYENAVSEIERLVALLEQPSEHHPVTVPDEVPRGAVRIEHQPGAIPRQRPESQGIHHCR